ncbi:MAG: HAMP domain-containing histidine kinase [Melioribacteraceae bacterium]|nr:HAMP domain-containing histidine kinase [Melioribacteraceae bacterium]
MDIILLEIIRAAFFGLIFVFMVYKGRKVNILKQRGWIFIVLGFGLLFFGSLIDITDEFSELAAYVIIGPTPLQAILEKIIGYTFGSFSLFTGFILWIPIILESFELTQKLKKAYHDLDQKINEIRTKNQFFAILAHDLRNPFAAIIGTTSMIKEDSDSFSKDEILALIDDVYNSGENTYFLLENLLAWSKTQMDDIKLDKKILKLKDLTNGILKHSKLSAQLKGITFINDVSNDDTVYADEEMILTVLRNLVTNAVKFTNEGGTVKIYSDHNGDHSRIVVEDNGIGINKDTLGRLFNIDSKFSSNGTAGERGTGLGLILCKEFLSKNNGDISVESTSGKGSRFIVTLPSKAID